MKHKIQKLITIKNKGNITSMIIGQMFILLIIIICLFNFKMYILNALFNNIDDALTSSLLAGAIVNVEEYGKSNQLIIHNGDAYNKGNWSEIEGAILLSELEYGSDIQLDKSVLDKKKTININSRGTATLSERKEKDDDEIKDWYSDENLRKSIESIVNTLKYNISNGAINSSDTINNITNDTASKMTLGRDIVNKFIAGGYIVGNIEVTRLDIYNVYKAELAERHVYLSEYMTYNTADKKEATTISWSGPSSENGFKGKYEPCAYEVNSGWEPGGSKRTEVTDINNIPADKTKKEEIYKIVDGDLVENENYAREYENYLRKLAKFKKDKDFWDNYGNKYHGLGSVCYINTHTTYQGNYDSNRVPYKYFYAKGNNFIPTDGVYGNDARPIKTNIDGTGKGEKAPIVGYSVFSYKNGYKGKYNASYDTTAVMYDSTPSIKIEYKDIPNGTDSIPLNSSKMSGAEIENTSLYIELTFTVTTFPKMANEDPKAKDLNTIPGEEKTVTVARLIDIDLNTDN